MVSRLTISRERTRRLGIVRGVVLVLLLGLAGYLFRLQVLQVEVFRDAAMSNSMRRMPIDGPRGFILDREGRQLVKNRSAFDAVVRLDRVSRVSTTLARLKQALKLNDEAVARVERLLNNKQVPEVVVAQDLSLAEVAHLEARALEWPEFHITKGLVRSYPFGVTAAHAIGHVGEVREQQLQTERYRDYRAGDVIGQTGAEARYERYLRGNAGSRWVLVNSRGREIRALDRIVAPQPGLDLTLTLDLDVQEAAELAFGDKRGAAVAIDPRNGEILALVSRPAYDPNVFASKMSDHRWRAYQTDPMKPMFDRALRATLPPGSVFKVVDAIAGLEERAWNPDATITCNGSTIVHGDSFRCWRPGGHGTVSLREAFRGSCNVFFYHRGDEVGIDGLAKWARRLGLGTRTGIDIEPEGPGVVPDPVWKRKTFREPWWPGETVSVAIGQGALQVSVLQIAMMMQVIANGGRAYVPHLVADVANGAARRAPEIAQEVELRPDTLRRVRDALWAVVNEREKGGTGGRAAIPGYGVSGKTGTAQAPDGPTADDHGEHAWFSGFAPKIDPRIVVAVYVERGGHGGEAAAPIARAMFETVIRKGAIPPCEEIPVPQKIVPAPPVSQVTDLTLPGQSAEVAPTVVGSDAVLASVGGAAR